ncbi:DNA damage response protein RcaA [Aspergillus clavatus NRRL 1]|uniref:DNA damage response protein RcaA n=1 Tax=Aspergillus clavatus (strain ATCC 1007 / CBS 513.65 / DSM 816 / NCTC 3887 / NRRL 1 / QM 1276 / 107) TaxID=344612 RepID=A1CGB2_ASPCL|nr:DNA damage response protein RcaA [Aspergillus clavatus NRRL 1]EAW10992.1 DNA damage response protein RcaA [Aspergillus clavatus NRRL 1]
MWILDSEGDFLEGKRVWLRPGKKYLFGRIRQDGVRHAIQHSSISRKHMVIEVSPVKPGDGSHIYTKSEITVHDQNSKCGTIVDGESIQGGSRKLSGEEHTIKLGRYQHALRIKWQPTVLSFSFSSKELRAKDPLAHVRSRLEDLDIKTIIPYGVDQTTHVVQSKRNTAKGLQALVNGKYIVQESYIDALVYAATPSDLENLESLSPLETDFDSAWPDPTEHLPPQGREVVQRPVEAFAPNPDRINIFEDYTFVFGDPSQFSNLQDPISNGHGKALLYPVENSVTTAEDIVQFMRNAAGRKGLGGASDGPGGVVLVRFRAKAPWETWAIELGNQVALMTNQRVIEQSEFLDAILGNDASTLCRPLPETTSSPEIGQTPTSQLAADETVDVIADSQAVEESSQPSPPPRRRNKSPRIRAISSKVKSFDDEFDIASIPTYTQAGIDHVVESQSAMDIAPASEQPSQHLSILDNEEDLVSSLLPGATAMKRRRAETVQRSLSDIQSHPPAEEPRKAKRQKLDVLEAARQHRDAEEDAQRKRRQEEEASLQLSLNEADVEQLKNLAIVEEMEIKPRAHTAEDSRWDERWNGRKNFKRFRRKGEPGQTRHRIQAVIVPLEEVTRRDFGIGDHYWVSSRQSTEPRPSETQGGRPVAHEEASRSRPLSRSLSRSQSRSRAQSQSQTHSISQVESATPISRSQKRVREEQDSDSDDELRFRFRRRR